MRFIPYNKIKLIFYLTLINNNNFTNFSFDQKKKICFFYNFYHRWIKIKRISQLPNFAKNRNRFLKQMRQFLIFFNIKFIKQ